MVVLAIILLIVILELVLNKEDNYSNNKRPSETIVVEKEKIVKDTTLDLVENKNTPEVGRNNKDEQLTESLKFIETVKLGGLEPSRIVMTGGENPSTKLGLTFNLPEFYEGVKVLVIDSDGYKLEAFETRYSKLMVNEDQDTIHVYKAEITGLQAGVNYTYMIKKGEDYSLEVPFRTVRKGTTEMAFFGDIQGYKLSQYTAYAESFRKAKERIPEMDFAYLAGDIVDDGETYDQWLFFDEASKEQLRSIPLLSAIGNHDVKGSAAIYQNTFNYPNNGPEGLEERCYYSDLPYARIAAIDTESYQRFDDQMAWLKSIMSEEVEGFKIVLMHRSVYPMSYDEAYVREWAPVFEELGIDLILSGHDHIYSRTTVKDNQKVELGMGPTYIVGGSGSGSKFYDNKHEAHRFWEDVVYDENYPVYLVLRIQEKQLDIEAYSWHDGVEDEVDIVHLLK